ncbi:MAG: acylphosphatase [Schwartzia sp. (in: firmicutes)]
MTVRYAGRAAGRVQGVGFRAFVERTAREMGFTGWVKNMPDGSVAMEVQGDEADFPALTAQIEAGNDWIEVRTLTWAPRPCVMDERAFTIRR